MAYQGPHICLVLHFDNFSGKLNGGYLLNYPSKGKRSVYMTADECRKYMVLHPNARCDPLKV